MKKQTIASVLTFLICFGLFQSMQAQKVEKASFSNAKQSTDQTYSARKPLPPLEAEMIRLPENDKRVQSLIDASEAWKYKLGVNKFKDGGSSFSPVKSVKPDRTDYVLIDNKVYYRFYLSEEKLARRFNPKDLDFDSYKGYILMEAQKDISQIADSIESVRGVESVEIVSQYYLKVYAPKHAAMNILGEGALDDTDGDYPGYFSWARLETAPYLPLKSEFPTNKKELKEYRTPFMRAFDTSEGEYQAILSIRPTGYPLISEKKSNG